MNVIIAVSNFLNPGQTPIVTVDQPLFTLAKTIQWKFPDTHGENKFVVMLGAMHTEKMVLEMLDDWLEGSGCTTALTNSGIASSGVAGSFIGVSQLTRTRYYHQVTALALYTLFLRAYDEYLASTTETDQLSLIDWTEMQTSSQPHFLYWYQTLELQLTALTFVKALRTADFKLYLEVLLQLMPWVFALDRIHYARNLPIHLRDMIALEELHPAIHNEFIAGRFVIQKTNNAFSSIALDQMPPTKDALYQHTLRAAYQAGHVWGQALITCPDLPEPSQWGWMKKETSWAPLWTTMPPISKSLKDLVTCQCKKMCKPPCECDMADVKCSTLCFCRGNCFRK
ncbi:hypothetical protein RRG08_040324 [Elysia crispata]|uniref:Uncharacterized protein n=1 Tax=Elysia crispata TaxID=231223 RepID=A0AAE1AG50_9GAST|nr:hypothetical protein RRG08_040324 [Elysia crispata]